MGVCCRGKQVSIDDNKSNISQSEQAFQKLLPCQQFKKIKVKRSNVNQRDQQCLILFVDSQCNIEKSQYFSKKQLKSIGRQVQSYVDTQKKQQHLTVGQSLIINLQIFQFNFTIVAILCISKWQKGKQYNLESMLTKLFSQLKTKNVKSICLTYFNNKFGIPSSTANKTIVQSVMANVNQFQSISVICCNIDTQVELIKAFNKHLGKDGVDSNISEQKEKADFY